MFLDIRETGVGETRVVSHETGLDITNLFSPGGFCVVHWAVADEIVTREDV